MLAVLLVLRGKGDARRVPFLSIFAGTSILLLSVSGVFRMLQEGSTGRNVLGRLDKAAIFALIAGTHTPVQGLFCRGVARRGVLGLIWLVAATGITLFSVFYDSLPRAPGRPSTSSWAGSEASRESPSGGARARLGSGS